MAALHSVHLATGARRTPGHSMHRKLSFTPWLLRRKLSLLLGRQAQMDLAFSTFWHVIFCSRLVSTYPATQCP